MGNGVVIEDAAVTETMGPIFDRTKEHLGAPDIAIVRFRRIMLDSARRVMEGGDPIGLDRPVDHRKIRSWHGNIEANTPWQDMVPDHVVLENREALETA
jgi:phthalate 4,5-dioxygenase